ncbi:MAG TPA: hypothetical protein VH117_02390 [Edaphobacter sp.]|jgi:hypothetical protein|nr:hypothetical protein [Edaphobacter sp.]
MKLLVGLWRVPAYLVESGEDLAGVAGADLVGREKADHFVDCVLEVGLAGGEREGEPATAAAAPGGFSGQACGWGGGSSRRLRV